MSLPTYKKSNSLTVHQRALQVAVASQRRRVASCLRPHIVQEVNRWELSEGCVGSVAALHRVFFLPYPLSAYSLKHTHSDRFKGASTRNIATCVTNLTLLRR